MGRRIDLPKLAPRGAKMTTGKGWRLVTRSKRRWFKASLLCTINNSGQRLAVFRVLK